MVTPTFCIPRAIHPRPMPFPPARARGGRSLKNRRARPPSLPWMDPVGMAWHGSMAHLRHPQGPAVNKSSRRATAIPSPHSQLAAAVALAPVPAKNAPHQARAPRPTTQISRAWHLEVVVRRYLRTSLPSAVVPSVLAGTLTCLPYPDCRGLPARRRVRNHSTHPGTAWVNLSIV